VLLSKFFKKNFYINNNLASFSLSLLSKKQKLFYKYFIIILEKEDKNEIDFFEEEAFLECLSSDKGLNSLIPYIIIYLNNFFLREKDSFLKILLSYRIIKALFLNNFLKLEPFVHQILPILLKGIVSTLSEDILLDDILSLKLFLANLINYIVNRFEKNNINLKSKLSFFFLKHFFYHDENVLLLYGALLGLTSLGNKIIELYVIPNLTIILFEIEKKKKKEIEFKEILIIQNLLNFMVVLITSFLIDYNINFYWKNTLKFSGKKINEEVFDVIPKLEKIKCEFEVILKNKKD
jgi:transcription initiation factor TFIID subunit 6